ncbi:hypothetical protein DSO57_1006286 [Entomophthora muscae]|uniref:Uncharacterized protein n=1 Tax=Entomophthora muscae TaxID=34485 RepID=A0ACC2SKE1_9FUNG|nr:hypothetical protein DSO57_1006286 [Entomophthora muscae]
METPTAAETMSTQLFGLLYIILTGMHPFYGRLYPLAWPNPILSRPMPLPMPGFLTEGLPSSASLFSLFSSSSSSSSSLLINL